MKDLRHFLVRCYWPIKVWAWLVGSSLALGLSFGSHLGPILGFSPQELCPLAFMLKPTFFLAKILIMLWLLSLSPPR